MHCRYDLIILLLFMLHNIEFAYNLVCYKCNGTTGTTDCNQLTHCSSNDERCYLTVAVNDTGVHRTMGCIGSQNCGFSIGIPSVIGRSVKSTKRLKDCHECCSSDLCNDHLCSYDNTGVCSDDVNTDCARLESVLQVCNDTHHAKRICKKFCGLCDLVDGEWSDYGSWSTCSASCGDGVSTKHRQCTNPAPAHGGLPCQGSASEQKTCNLKPCIVDGKWGDWQGWTTCSASCGAGVSSRLRKCNNPTPAYGGLNCTGNYTELKACNLETCPVHGNWSDWGNWSVCSATCDMGMKSRLRNCDNPTPGPTGHYCVGEPTQYTMCMTTACADGGWSNWTAWNNCTAQCGGGFRTRDRLCNNPTPSVMGKFCQGNPQDVSACNGGQCPAFNARKADNYPVNVNATMPFQTEMLDIGNGYNPTTSIYTAPLTGTYSFMWTIHILYNGDYTTGLVVNNVVKHYLQTTTQTGNNYVTYVTSTAHTIVALNKGDTVFIRLLRKNVIASPSIMSDSNGYTSFEGWMLN